MNKKQLFLEKSLPHNFLAEKMILSCLLINFEAIELTISMIPIEAFYFKNHQEIYKAIIFMYQKKFSIDILSLTSFLQETGLLKKIGGIKVLLELIHEAPNLIYLEEYIRLVKDKFLRRSLIKFGYKLINSGYVTNLSLENILENLEIELFTLTNEVKIQTTLSSAELLNDMFSELKEKFLNPRLPGLSSGFSNLDLLTQGFQKSDLIIIAGRPSMGKTALSLNIALNSIKISQLPVLFFSLEMSEEQIMYRILSIETNINQMRLKNGNLYKNDWIKLNKIIKIVSKLPLFIDGTANLTIQDIRSKIKTVLLDQTKLGLVIIDYLQLMYSSDFKNGNRVQELSQITRALKNLAREFNVPIIALSQLSRNVDNRIDQKPMLSDLRESGSIEQDADLVLMLYRGKLTNLNQNEISSITELTIAKQRNGPIGTIKLTFDENQTKFLELNNSKPIQ
jgi:replicative DNA helicase|uniref:Replicative DNA helicase n=1 Tax=Tryblionella apiculata TaxID=1003145 RepID=A0A8F1B8A5_9STRA|nr:DNA-replication helicase subunit [Tryblionella apiculata]QWM93550.1 DNA-replication helicase subunit [Tryblionella apiculata]